VREVEPAPSPRRALPTFLRVIIFTVALVPTVVYLVVALRRLGYPYELEWLEGGAVEIVRRVSAGHQIYVQPSVHYVPYPYTPLYFWMSGVLSYVTGVGFLPLRLVSLLSSLGSCVVLFMIVWKETRDALAAFLATGLFTATFAVSGAWFDIGRVDSLALFLLLICLYVARRAQGIRGGLLVGLLVFVAFMTKQNALLAAAPVLLMLSFTRRRVGITALITTAALVVGSTVLMNSLTHNWYGYYVFTELTHQHIERSVWKTFFTKDLRHTPWSIGLGLLGIFVAFRSRASSIIDWPFWSVAVAGLLGSALISRLHSGGGEDVLIQAFAGVALLGSFGFSMLDHYVSNSRTTMKPTWAPTLVGALLTAAVAVQIGALHYSPTRYIPTTADQRAGASFVALVRSISGPVIVSNHPYYETLAGKASWAQGEAAYDVMRAGPSRARSDLSSSIDTFLRSSLQATIFSDDPHYALGSYSDPYFRLTSTHVFSCDHCFYPVTDIKRRPGDRFERRPS
jgi:4-amino-4-deoxy-L-arabinose transferase-like glycosyltransferase